MPLGEAAEAYLVRVMQGAVLVRETTVAVPTRIYTAAEQLADGVSLPFTVRVAQLSDRFGAGLFKGIVIDV